MRLATLAILIALPLCGTAAAQEPPLPTPAELVARLRTSMLEATPGRVSFRVEGDPRFAKPAFETREALLTLIWGEEGRFRLQTRGLREAGDEGRPLGFEPTAIIYDTSTVTTRAQRSGEEVNLGFGGPLLRHDLPLFAAALQDSEALLARFVELEAVRREGAGAEARLILSGATLAPRGEDSEALRRVEARTWVFRERDLRPLSISARSLLAPNERPGPTQPGNLRGERRFILEGWSEELITSRWTFADHPDWNTDSDSIRSAAELFSSLRAILELQETGELELRASNPLNGEERRFALCWAPEGRLRAVYESDGLTTTWVCDGERRLKTVLGIKDGQRIRNRTWHDAQDPALIAHEPLILALLADDIAALGAPESLTLDKERSDPERSDPELELAAPDHALRWRFKAGSLDLAAREPIEDPTSLLGALTGDAWSLTRFELGGVLEGDAFALRVPEGALDVALDAAPVPTPTPSPAALLERLQAQTRSAPSGLLSFGLTLEPAAPALELRWSAGRRFVLTERDGERVRTWTSDGERVLVTSGEGASFAWVDLSQPWPGPELPQLLGLLPESAVDRELAQLSVVATEVDGVPAWELRWVVEAEAVGSWSLREGDLRPLERLLTLGAERIPSGPLGFSSTLQQLRLVRAELEGAELSPPEGASEDPRLLTPLGR